MLNKIKETVSSNINKNIRIRINNIRNKSEFIDGFITEVYDRIFVIKCSDSITRSFNYSDILTGTIEIM